MVKANAQINAGTVDGISKGLPAPYSPDRKETIFIGVSHVRNGAVKHRKEKIMKNKETSMGLLFNKN